MTAFSTPLCPVAPGDHSTPMPKNCLKDRTGTHRIHEKVLLPSVTIRRSLTLSVSFCKFHAGDWGLLGDGLAPLAGNLTGPRAVASLTGPFRLRLVNGQDITPASQVRQAILAVLLSAPRQSRSRRQLQEMFWGMAERKKASGNLRTALYALKRDLRALGPDVIVTNPNAVSLATGIINTEAPSPISAEFLEGLDLGLDGCEMFEEWLRDMRAAQTPMVGDIVDAPHAQPSNQSILPNLTPLRDVTHATVALGLLPTLRADLSEADALRIEGVTDDMARMITFSTTLNVFDLRGSEIRAVPLPIESGRGPSHLLQSVVEKRGETILLSLRLHDAWSRRLVWVSDPIDVWSSDSAEIAAATTEILLSHLSSATPGIVPDLFPWTALAALFSLKPDEIARIEKQIDRMVADGGPEILRCLGIFAQIFKGYEGVAPPQVCSAEELCELLSTVPESDPMRPLWDSLAGYSAHMLIGDNDLAETLIHSAHRRAPNLALNLDHLAVLRLARGDLAGAEAAFQQCQRVGVNSPWRYTYDVTGSMIAMARGDLRGSLLHANRALIRKPRFVGALRYAMAGFVLSGNLDDARRMQARILRIRPSYDLERWTRSMMERAPEELGDALDKGFRHKGLT